MNSGPDFCSFPPSLFISFSPSPNKRRHSDINLSFCLRFNFSSAIFATQKKKKGKKSSLFLFLLLIFFSLSFVSIFTVGALRPRSGFNKLGFYQRLFFSNLELFCLGFFTDLLFSSFLVWSFNPRNYLFLFIHRRRLKLFSNRHVQARSLKYVLETHSSLYFFACESLDPFSFASNYIYL